MDSLTLSVDSIHLLPSLKKSIKFPLALVHQMLAMEYCIQGRMIQESSVFEKIHQEMGGTCEIWVVSRALG